MDGREPAVDEVVQPVQRLAMGWRAELLIILAGAAAGLVLGLLIHLGSPGYTMSSVWKAVGSAVVILVASRAIVLLGLWEYRQMAKRRVVP